jgi:metallo-beta-lactamase class B/metallo-beta-lactamase class B GIM
VRLIPAIIQLFLVVNAIADEEVPDLQIEEIQGGVYLHKSFNHVSDFGLLSSNGLVVVDKGKAFIVDTPWSARDTEKLVEWINKKNYTLQGSLSTHSHDDRTAGIEWLNARAIPTYASALTNEFLRKEHKAMAKISFDSEEFSLGDGLMEAFYPGAGHTQDNIVVWLPESELLYGGCFVRSLTSRGLGYTGEADIENWPSSVDSVLSRYPKVKIVIPGHGKPGDIQLLIHTKALARSASDK